MPELSIPAGSFNGALQLAARQSTQVVADNLTDVFALEEPVAIVAQTKGIELRPLAKIDFEGQLQVTLQAAAGFTVSAQQTHVFYKVQDAAGHWQQGIISADDLTITGQSLQFAAAGFGRFTLINLSRSLPASLGPISEGAGYWYGFDTDLYSDFAQPALDGPDLSSYSFDKSGVVVAASANGTDYIPPPFDFSELAEADATTVYSAPSNVALDFAILTHDADYMLWMDLRRDEPKSIARLLQRKVVSERPTAALDTATLAGSYHGSSVKFKYSSSFTKDSFSGHETLVITAADQNFMGNGFYWRRGVDRCEFCTDQRRRWKFRFLRG